MSEDVYNRLWAIVDQYNGEEIDEISFKNELEFIMKVYEINFETFRKICGFGYSSNVVYTVESTMHDFLEIYDNYGKEALNSEWLNKNGYTNIVRRVFRYGIKWPAFLHMCGFTEGTYNTSLISKIPIVNLKDAFYVFREISFETSEKKNLLRSSWVQDNYPWFLTKLRNIDISWSNFIREYYHWIKIEGEK
jgi:hypothetical protein